MMDARARRIIEGGQRLSCVEARVARRSARLGAAAEGGGAGPARGVGCVGGPSAAVPPWSSAGTPPG
jgi:hypothetical protein